MSVSTYNLAIMARSLFLEKRLGTRSLPPTNFEIYLIFSSFQRSSVLSRSSNLNATRTQSLLN